MQGFPQSWRAKFTILWAGQSVSLLTSSILQMAIVWYLTEKTGSAAVLSFATLIGYLPAAVLGMFIGTFVDRYSRKRIMILADVSIALLGIVLAVSGLQGEIPIWLIMLVLLLRSFGSAFHYPALQSVTPSLVPQEHLTKYAGYSQSFESVSMVLSPAIAAFLFSIWDLTAIIFLDVAGALFAIFLLCFVELPKHQAPAKKSAGLLHDTLDGLRELRRVRGMTQLMTVGALYAVIYFPIGSLYPFMTMDYFGGSFTESGMVEVVFSVGTLAGSLLLGLLGDRLPKIPAMAASIGIYGLGVLLSGLLPPGGLKLFLLLSLTMGVVVPFYSGIETAIFQMKFKQEYLGRIFSLSSSVSTLAMPVGLILSGAFADTIGINKLFIIAGALALLLAVFTVALPALRACGHAEDTV